jgi:predicted nucleic acid-binding protein
LQEWPLLHCTIALGEIAHVLGRLDPAHPQTAQQRAYFENLLRRIPAHRVINPDADLHIQSGIITGLLARLLFLPKGAHRQRINDALLCLTAHKAGAAILTADVSDFDLIQQLVPSASVIYYETSPLA